MRFVTVHLQMIEPWCYVPIANETAIRYFFFFVENLTAGLFSIRTICSLHCSLIGLLHLAIPALNRNAYASHEVTPLKSKQTFACPGTHSCMKRLGIEKETKLGVAKFFWTPKRYHLKRNRCFLSRVHVTNVTWTRTWSVFVHAYVRLSCVTILCVPTVRFL